MATRTTHSRLVAAPADEVYRLVADVTIWPVMFSPTVSVRHLHRTECEERFQLWALVAGGVQTWVSRRSLDPVARRVTFQQERSHPPISGMAGTWSFTPASDGMTEVVLDHAFSVTDDDALQPMISAVDRNSTEELAALGRIAELGHPVDELVDTFSDTVVVDGPLPDVYDFVYRGDLWPERLPHVARVDLSEDEAGVQRMEMETVTADGAAHVTSSIRVCSTNSSIVYKQLLPPRMLLGHSGQWSFSRREDGVEVTATHMVAIDPDAARSVIGSNGTLDDAREYVRAVLGGNSRATLARARSYVAGRG
ncbi:MULTISPECIES: aromatase/cyclase [unclassified Pseudofrankia]|uniref:aromatase/cyclase n=1 Tax=unclassified Pseudofrankia TaxID=2994372 RepID=UPI0008DA1B0D|nr:MULTISPECIES: aromatase/cyclase [unclassified Pseudofrankia]MDT3442574.1 aromatase/cyclase [Pseudofrankia sp. BMG5.37]OHV71770.1 cyclase [Pseudofrankia sp. BMG5.36]